MALTDVTDGSRIIKEGKNPGKITLTGAVKVGDLVAATGVQADADANLPAKWIAGETAPSGAKITVFESAIIGNLSGATLGNAVYLSDTGGGYSEEASTTSRQQVGIALSATDIMVDPDMFARRMVVSFQAGAADIVGTTSAAIIYLATERMRVTKISEVHAVVAGQAGTATVEKLTGTQAPGGGVGADLLGDTKVNLAGTINTVQSPALTGTVASLVLEVGNRLALKLATGAATALANSQWSVELERA